MTRSAPDVRQLQGLPQLEPPVILRDEDYDRWLLTPIEEPLSLACAYPPQLVEVA